MASKTPHLRALLSKEASFSWSDQHGAEFRYLKTVLVSPDIMLFHPNWDHPFEVHTDASKIGCGAMLAQYHGDKLRPVRFASRSFSPTESRWPTAHQELFAVKWALQHFRPYLMGRKFTVITDHANLKFLSSIAPQNSKLARWCLSLAEFDFIIEHRPGRTHVVPDALSRAPLPSSIEADMLFLPPSETVDFFIQTFALDIPSFTAIHNGPLHCLHLACNANHSSHAATNTAKVQAHIVTEQPQTHAPSSETDITTALPSTPSWHSDLQFLNPLNLSRIDFAKLQRRDAYLGPLIQYLSSNCSAAILRCLDARTKRWTLSVAKRATLRDGILFYADEFMDDPDHLRIFVPCDITFQRHLLYAYHNSPLGMHRGRDATYHCLSRDFYWRNMSKHVHNWIRRCHHCIAFKTLNQAHGPMQIRIFEHPFHTLGVDYVGELPPSPSGNKWILTAVCPFSNFLRAIPVADKTATTAVRALLDQIFFQVGFPSVLQSDRGGEFLNAIMHRLTAMLSIQQVYTSGFRPRLNGATERVHRFLNAALGIFCEKNQERWEEFLQPAVYAHNTAPISGTKDITPFFLVFGRHAPSPETIALHLPPIRASADQYAHNLVSRMKQAHAQFRDIKADLRRRQRELYDIASRDLEVPEGKIVYMRK